VILFDAGEGADLLLRSLALAGGQEYHVVGFLDDDEFNHGRRIHDVEVLGGTGKAIDLLRAHGVEGVLAIPGATSRPGFPGLRAACAEAGVWIRELHIGFEEI
jgi:FlaA1/EpsC-like NDP-sugar epimerase